jgi:hypothetical protein
MLRAILDYAVVINNAALKRFARDGYEFTRNLYYPEVGLFMEWTKPWGGGETCEMADMVALAIRLSDSGIGGYWEDVDRFVRNQLVEQQHVPETGTEKAIGTFVIGGEFVSIREGQIAGCCTDNGSQALYYAWESILRVVGKHVRINLLLNRASPQMDIDSYLPYEGKVVLKNKKAKSCSVRLPAWVDLKAVTSRAGGRVAAVYSGRPSHAV